MKKTSLIALLTAAFLASSLLLALNSAHAQNTADRVQHRVQHMTNLLSLTAAQQQQATTIFTNAANGMQTIRTGMQTAHQNLQQAIAANNAAAIDQDAATIGSLTQQMVDTRAKAEAAFYQTLTSEQQTKLTEFESMHARGRHGHWKNSSQNQQ